MRNKDSRHHNIYKIKGTKVGTQSDRDIAIAQSNPISYLIRTIHPTHIQIGREYRAIPTRHDGVANVYSHMRR